LERAAVEKSTFTREYAAFCRLLRETRERAGLTQVELAEKIGETQSYVSKVERGERRLDLVQLQVFCRALKTSLCAFVAEFEGSSRQRK
jgi:transcriptional regulator with XRE-family HTH domain